RGGGPGEVGGSTSSPSTFLSLKRINDATSPEKPPADNLRVLFELVPFRWETLFLLPPTCALAQQVVSLLSVQHVVAIRQLSWFLCSWHRFPPTAGDGSPRCVSWAGFDGVSLHQEMVGALESVWQRDPTARQW